MWDWPAGWVGRGPQGSWTPSQAIVSQGRIFWLSGCAWVHPVQPSGSSGWVLTASCTFQYLFKLALLVVLVSHSWREGNLQPYASGSDRLGLSAACRQASHTKSASWPTLEDLVDMVSDRLKGVHSVLHSWHVHSRGSRKRGEWGGGEAWSCLGRRVHSFCPRCMSLALEGARIFVIGFTVLTLSLLSEDLRHLGMNVCTQTLRCWVLRGLHDPERQMRRTARSESSFFQIAFLPC